MAPAKAKLNQGETNSEQDLAHPGKGARSGVLGTLSAGGKVHMTLKDRRIGLD